MLKNIRKLRDTIKRLATQILNIEKEKKLQVDGIGRRLSSVTAENLPQIPERCTHSNVMIEKYFMT